MSSLRIDGRDISIHLKFEKNVTNVSGQGGAMHRGKYSIGEHGPVYRAIESGLWALAPGLILLLALTYPSMKAARQDNRMDLTIAAEQRRVLREMGYSRRHARTPRLHPRPSGNTG